MRMNFLLIRHKKIILIILFYFSKKAPLLRGSKKRVIFGQEQVAMYLNNIRLLLKLKSTKYTMNYQGLTEY